MILLPIIALLVGAMVAFVLPSGPLGGPTGQYLAVACLAGLDSVCGGVRSGLEGKFSNAVFTSGFFANILIAFFLSWLGDRIYLPLYLAVALVLGQRIFTNLSLTRRFLLTKYQDAQDRKRLQSTSSPASVSPVEQS